MQWKNLETVEKDFYKNWQEISKEYQNMKNSIKDI